jgi:hypothetical protein
LITTEQDKQAGFNSEPKGEVYRLKGKWEYDMKGNEK